MSTLVDIEFRCFVCCCQSSWYIETMQTRKIVRTVCYFTNDPSPEIVARISKLSARLEEQDYLIQTKRICTTIENIESLRALDSSVVNYTSIGTVSYDNAKKILPVFMQTDGMSFNIDLAQETIDVRHVEILYDIIKTNPSKTFNFTYTFNNSPSSPYFPSAAYQQNGFVIGLQPTDLAVNCNSLDDWLKRMKECWNEIAVFFAKTHDFLGIDSSIAPMRGKDGSFMRIIKRICGSFSSTVTTDIYTKITKFIKENNPKPMGLCGLMLPCLEDDELAAEYEQGNFSIERNIYLSLHSGLGIDTYPMGVDEKPERVVEVLKLIQALSNKYQKPLSARFVSDGKTRIGSKTNFQNQYLVDCTIRPL